MFREDVKPPDLKELIGKKILMCKKDIRCKGGTLAKGSLVYPCFHSKDHKAIKISALYDISQCYNLSCASIHSCRDYLVKEEITVENYDDYFQVNTEATACLCDIEKELESSYKISDKYEFFMGAFGIGLIISVISLALFFELDNAAVCQIGTIISGSAVALFIILMSICIYMKDHIIIKANETYKRRMAFLASIASDNEYTENCDEEIKKLKRTLTTLANSAAIDTGNKKDRVCLLKTDAFIES